MTTSVASSVGVGSVGSVGDVSFGCDAVVVVWLSVSFGSSVLPSRGGSIMVVCVEGARGVGDVVMEG